MEKQSTRKVRVIAPGSGMRAGGRMWPGNGQETHAELTDAELLKVASKPGFIVRDANGKRIVVDRGPGTPLFSEPLTHDEMAVLAEYRAKREEDPSIAEKYGTSAPRFHEEPDKSTPTPAVSPGAPAPSAALSPQANEMAPLENREVLHGAKPPESEPPTAPAEETTVIRPPPKEEEPSFSRHDNKRRR